MEIRVLGALKVIGDAGPIPLRAFKHRQLLAALVIGRSEHRSADTLIDALWGPCPPASASKLLQVYVSQLRGTLPEPAQIITTGRGYKLEIDEGDVDAGRFERLLAEGTRALRDGNAGLADTLLQRALALWRGLAYGEFAYEEFARLESERLEELRLMAREQRIDARLALGSNDELVAELRALVNEHPLRERMVAQAMRCLCRCGRQTEALELFKATRTRLREDLGLEPSRELRDLERQVLQHDPALLASWPAGVVSPSELPTQGSRIGLPTRLAPRPPIGVIGRESELATLETAAKRVAQGDGREIILVAGEPGQGKTVLVSEVARRAHEADMTVLLGRADEEVRAPYGLMHEALSHYVVHADAEVLMEHITAHGAELAPLVPALRRRFGGLPSPLTTDADTERFLLYEAVAGLLEQASADRPVVLVLEDLHWADKPSLQLVRHVVARTSSARLLVLGTYRDAELSADHAVTEMIAGLHREPSGVSMIDLQGFDETEVIALIESAAGHELDDAGAALAHQLYGETDGNPFFVAEVLRHLSESGAICHDATGRWIVPDNGGHLPLPPSVCAVISARISRLGDTTTKVLSTASVIGRDFDLRMLAAATGVNEDALIDLLDRAVHAALVVELPRLPGHYSFCHALIQHALYEDLGVMRRAQLHQAVGETIEHLYRENINERLGELARHFLLATKPPDAQKAIAYARQAGAAALSALAPDEAVHYLSQALDLASRSTIEPSLHIDLVIGLGIAQRQAGIPGFRVTLLKASRAAREQRDTERLVAATLANHRGYHSGIGDTDAERVEMLQAALEALPSTDSPRRARLLSRFVQRDHVWPARTSPCLGQGGDGYGPTSGGRRDLCRCRPRLPDPPSSPANPRRADSDRQGSTGARRVSR